MSNSFNFLSTPLDNLFEVERNCIEDHRGFFSRLFCTEEFKEIGLIKPFVQVNYTMTRKKGTVRGMHFQKPPFAENKIVTCVKGEVLDIAVDIRKNSKTFLNYHSVVLSDTNFKSLYIPEGFAHGFQTLTRDCQLLYLHSELYIPSAEAIINPMDSMLSIQWPCKISEISDRDANAPFLDNTFKGLKIT